MVPGAEPVRWQIIVGCCWCAWRQSYRIVQDPGRGVDERTGSEGFSARRFSSRVCFLLFAFAFLVVFVPDVGGPWVQMETVMGPNCGLGLRG
ncbi:hypothetical protein BJX96DRAFT_79765 [Aspergillus floccosus]